MVQEWQTHLSMAERLSATMKIMAQCKRSYPGLEKSDLRERAKSIEDTIFNNASSSDNYQQRCEEAIKALTSPGDKKPASSVDSSTTGDCYVPPADRPIEQIGPYLATYHASGLFSTVYHSKSTSASSAMAIKLTTPSVMAAPHNSRREARLLRLAAHPSIIPLLSTETIPGGHFLLIFPFLPYDLGTLLDKGALTPAQIRIHLRKLFEALAHCHAQGVLHRDIKPSNLLLKSLSGPAYLADFGIAWHDDDPESEAADAKITDVGTTCYRAPELLFGYGDYRRGVDLWAAGCVVAEAENGGRSLFDAGDVGSELALIRSIFTTLGTPNEEVWPELKHFPDWGKVRFTQYPAKEWQTVLPRASDAALELVSTLVRYESGERKSAAEVLEHQYFASDLPS